MKLRLLHPLALAIPAIACAQTPTDIKGFAPVSVSSANYRDTSREVLLQMVNRKNAVNPQPRELTPLSTPKYYVFIPGEIFPSDLNYESVCDLLTAALARKGYLNAADSVGIIREPGKVTLMLRINYGVSPWRLPVVRTKHLAWDEGLVGKVHDSRSITHLGAERVWDSRAGGNDDSLSAAAANESKSQAIWGGNETPNTGAAVLINSTASGQTAYESTREFNLVVVDAFDYTELKSKGRSAECLWTTFVAAPVQRGEKFSAALAAMLRAAAPYWGETTAGMQVYDDARAKVILGEITEVKDEPPGRK
jgi:hypothetical protein